MIGIPVHDVSPAAFAMARILGPSAKSAMKQFVLILVVVEDWLYSLGIPFPKRFILLSGFARNQSKRSSFLPLLGKVRCQCFKEVSHDGVIDAITDE